MSNMAKRSNLILMLLGSALLLTCCGSKTEPESSETPQTTAAVTTVSVTTAPPAEAEPLPAEEKNLDGYDGEIIEIVDEE